MNILITAATTAGAFRLAGLAGAGHTVFFGDSAELPQIPGGKNNFIRIPPAGSPSFAHQLLTICLDLDIEKVYPLRRAEVAVLAEAAELFAEYGIKTVVPPLPVVREASWSKGPGTLIIRGDDKASEPGSQKGAGIFIITKDGQNEKTFLFTAD